MNWYEEAREDVSVVPAPCPSLLRTEINSEVQIASGTHQTD